MAAKQSTNIANGILSGLVLICGIVLSVLVAVLMQRFLQMNTVGISTSGFDTENFQMYGESQYWAIGFAYIVPGLIGVIASPVRQKWGYIVQMVFDIITLVLMAIFLVLGLLLIASLRLYEFTTCSELAGTCVCNNGYRASINFGSNCNDITAIGAMGIGITVMIIIGWIFLLAACITGGILACSRDDSPGRVIHTSQPSVNSMHLGHMSSSQPYIVQPGSGYDQQSKSSYENYNYEKR